MSVCVSAATTTWCFTGFPAGPPNDLLATMTSLVHHVQLQKAEKSEADEVDEEPAVVQSAQVFAPKSLVLVSRLDYTEVFRV